jgi:hypothetical protein
VKFVCLAKPWGQGKGIRLQIKNLETKGMRKGNKRIRKDGSGHFLCFFFWFGDLFTDNEKMRLKFNVWGMVAWIQRMRIR